MKYYRVSTERNMWQWGMGNGALRSDPVDAWNADTVNARSDGVVRKWEKELGV